MPYIKINEIIGIDSPHLIVNVYEKNKKRYKLISENTNINDINEFADKFIKTENTWKYGRFIIGEYNPSWWYGNNDCNFIVKLKDKWYFQDWLRENIPQMLCLDSINKKIILMNRNGNTINHMTDLNNFKQTLLINVFTDSKNPWRGEKEDYDKLKYVKEEYNKLLNKYNDYEVLNSNENVDYIFNL